MLVIVWTHCNDILFPVTMTSSMMLLLLASFAGAEHEYRLTKYLMSNYDKSVRPVANALEPISVKFDVSLHQIIDVDEKNQVSRLFNFSKYSTFHYIE